MHIVYCTDYSSLVSVSQWVCLQHWEDYVIISSTSELAVRVSTSDCSVVVFDYVGDREVQRILSSAFFLKDLQVMAGNSVIARQYCSITENIFVIPAVIDLAVLLWGNPAFSLKNIEKSDGKIVVNSFEDLSNCKKATIEFSTKEDEAGVKRVGFRTSRGEEFKVVKPDAKSYQTYNEVVVPVLKEEDKVPKEGESISEFRKRQLSSIPVSLPSTELEKTTRMTIDNAKKVLSNEVGSKGLLIKSKFERIGTPTSGCMDNAYSYFRKFYKIPKYEGVYQWYLKESAIEPKTFETFLLDHKVIGVDDYLEFNRCFFQKNVLLHDDLGKYKYNLFDLPDGDSEDLSRCLDYSKRLGVLEIVSSNKKQKAFLVNIDNESTKTLLNSRYNNPLLYFTHSEYILGEIESLVNEGGES